MESVALAAETVALPSSVVPAKKETVPVSVVPPAMEAVSVTGEPAVELATDWVSVVVLRVRAAETLTVEAAEVEAALLESPA